MTDSGITTSLFERAAARLAGRQVTVRIQEPVWNNTSGACYKNEKGGCIVDVNPGASDLLLTFCHECAHARLNFSEMAPSAYWRCEPGSQVLPHSERVELRALPREDRADQLARRWMDYAIKNSWRYFDAMSPLEARLRALENMPKTEVMK